MQNIALFGKMRSGKNAVAEVMAKEQGYSIWALSDGITDIISKYFPEAYYTMQKPRKHYTHIGQSLRALNEDVWVNHTLRKIEKNSLEGVVIADCRQLNEEALLRDNGFLIVKVEADLNSRLERCRAKQDAFELADLQHETEQAVDCIIPDVTIVNYGTMEELEQKVKKFLEDLDKGEDIHGKTY